MKPEIIIIAAICANRAIGRKGDLLYHISSDLKRFKEITMGHPIIMGRKTFESFPKGPLPGRRNIIISHNPTYSPTGAEVYHNPNAALEACSDSKKIFIIGGGEIYRYFLPIADTLLLTEIEASPNDADTFFPPIPTSFKLAENIPATSDSSPKYRFAKYVKI